MASSLILSFIAAVLFVWGLPHIINGVQGKKFTHPFGLTESPAASLIWGWICWVVAVLLWHIAPMRFHPRATFVGAAIGVLVTGLVMSGMTAKVPARARKTA